MRVSGEEIALLQGFDRFGEYPERIAGSGGMGFRPAGVPDGHHADHLPPGRR
jgi:hypothetical protein